jgi:hypothetical protein
VEEIEPQGEVVESAGRNAFTPYAIAHAPYSKAGTRMNRDERDKEDQQERRQSCDYA